MSRPANLTEVMDDFPGMVNNADEHETPSGGGVEQVNLCPRMVGELRTRRGLLPCQFETSSLTGLTATG